MASFDPNKQISEFLDKIDFSRVETRGFKRVKIDVISKIFTYLEEHHIDVSYLSAPIRYRLVKTVINEWSGLEWQTQQIYKRTLLKNCTLGDAITALQDKQYPLLQELLFVQEGADFSKELLLCAMRQDEQQAIDLICNSLSDKEVLSIFQLNNQYHIKFMLSGNSYAFEKLFNRLSQDERNLLFSSYHNVYQLLKEAFSSGSRRVAEIVYNSLPVEFKNNFLKNTTSLLTIMIITVGNRELHAFFKEIIYLHGLEPLIFSSTNSILDLYIQTNFHDKFFLCRQNNPRFEFDPKLGLEALYTACPDNLKLDFLSAPCIFFKAKMYNNLDLIPTLIKIYPQELKDQLIDFDILLHVNFFDSVFYKTNVLIFLSNCSDEFKEQAFNKKSAKGDNLLHIAVLYRSLEDIQQIFDLCPPNLKYKLLEPNQDGNTPFHLAASAGYNEMKLIYDLCPLDVRGDLWGRNEEGDTAFHLLLKYSDSDSDIPFLKECLTLYPLAMRRNLIDKNRAGNTPFHSAVQSKDLSIILFLYDLAAPDQINDLFSANEEGDTPLHLIVRFGDAHLIKTIYSLCPAHLREQQFVKNRVGHTPFHYVVQSRSLTAMNEVYDLCPQALRQSLFEPNFNGDTPLHLAKTNYLEIFELAPEELRSTLLQINNQWKSPIDLFFESDKNYPEIIFLLEKLPGTEAIFDKLTVTQLKNLVSSCFPDDNNYLESALAFKNMRLDVVILDYLIEHSVHNDLQQILVQRVMESPEHLFLSPYVLSYFVERHMDFILAEIEKLGGLDQLDAEQLVSVLPLLPPYKVVEVIDQIPLEQKEQLLSKQVEHEEETFSLQEILTYMSAQYLPSLGEANVSNVVLGALQSVLAKIPLSTLSLLTRESPEEILPFVSYMDDNQLAATIPFIDPNRAVKSVTSTIRQAYLVKRMTLDQKKKTLKEVNFYPAGLSSLEQRAVDLQASFKSQEELITLQGRFLTFNVQLLEIQRLKEAFLKNESDEELVAHVHLKEQEAAVKLAHLKNLISTISSLSDNTPSEFIDELMGVEMSDPILLPITNVYVDLSTVKTFEKGDIEGVASIKNPYTQSFFPESAYQVDEELKSRIAERRGSKRRFDEVGQ